MWASFPVQSYTKLKSSMEMWASFPVQSSLTSVLTNLRSCEIESRHNREWKLFRKKFK
jgi:hypothetical protein